MNAGWAHVPKDRPEFTQIALDLDECFILTLFKDEEYANFWKQNWGAKKIQKEKRVQPAKEIIPWSTFIQVFYDYLKKFGVQYPVNPESDVYYLSFKAIALEPTKHDSVSLERLLLIEKWFGPLCTSPVPLVGNSVSSPALPNLTLSLPTPLDPPSSRKSPTIKSSRETKARSNISSTRRDSHTQSPISRSSSTAETATRTNSTSSITNSKAKTSSRKEKPITASKDDIILKSSSDKQEVTSPKNSPLIKKELPKEETEVEKKLQRGRVNRNRTKSQIGKNKPTSIDESPRRELSHSERRRRLSRTGSGRQRTLGKLPRTRTSIKLSSEQKKEKPEEFTILGSIKRILEHTWFHGDITKEDADSTLATNRTIEGHKIFGSHGDFLIRASFSEPVEQHPFTITKVNKKGAIFHHRIFYNEAENRYSIHTKTDQASEVSGDSLISLVKQLIDLKIVSQPCKRWNYARKYADIFEKKISSEDHGYVDTEDLRNLENNHPNE